MISFNNYYNLFTSIPLDPRCLSIRALHSTIVWNIYINIYLYTCIFRLALAEKAMDEHINFMKRYEFFQKGIIYYQGIFFFFWRRDLLFERRRRG